MVNDPIGDMLAQMKNAYMAGKAAVSLPHSKMKEAVARILAEEGYLASVAVGGEHPKKTLALSLRYDGTKPAITDVKRKSKPGLRVYRGAEAIPMVVGGMGTAILSTPLGVMTGKQAKKKHVGGELLCEVW